MSLFAAATNWSWKEMQCESRDADSTITQPFLRSRDSHMRSTVDRSTLLTLSACALHSWLRSPVTMECMSAIDPTSSREQGCFDTPALPIFPQPARAGDCDSCPDPLRSPRRWQHPLGGPQHAPATPFSRGHQECGWKRAGAWTLRACRCAKSPRLSTVSMNSERKPP